MPDQQLTRQRWLFMLLFVAGVVWLYHLRYGLGVLNPVNDGWLIVGDWATQYIGWYFYRNEPWTFPLGTISAYLHPAGTNIGLTDSIPLVAIPLKLIAPWLPEKFQYFGWWLFMCHVLTAWFALRLFEELKVTGWLAFVATALVVVNPVLLQRSLHPALCAQWLILASAWYYVRDPRSKDVHSGMTGQSALLVIGCLINPYFSIFQMAFLLAQAWKNVRYDHVLTLRQAAMRVGGTLVVLTLCWYFIGMIGSGGAGLSVTGAYGLYALNLNSLYNSFSWSKLIPAQKTVSWHQYESFLFLGAGFLALVPLTIGWMSYKRPTIKVLAPWVPWITACVLLTFFAITNTVTLNDLVLFRFDLPEGVMKLSEIFRASARYGWALYYSLIVFSLVVVVRFATRPMAMGLLCLTLGIQLYDISPLILVGSDKVLWEARPYTPPLSAEWNDLFSEADHFVFVPPYEATYATETDYRYFSYLAASHRRTVTLGYVARANQVAMNDFTDSLRRELNFGHVSPRTIYVTTPRYADRFLVPFDNHSALATKLDGYVVFFPESRRNDFASLTIYSPPELEERLRFTAYSAALPNEVPADGRGLVRLERAAGSCYLKGWILPAAGRSATTLLRSGKNVYTAPSSTLFGVASDSLYFGGNYLIDNLPPGEYETGVLLSGDKGEEISWLGWITVGGAEDWPVENPKILPQDDSSTVDGWIDLFDASGSRIKITGWAVMVGQPSIATQTRIALRKGEAVYTIPTDPLLREDVVAFRNTTDRIEWCGLRTSFLKSDLPEGEYEVGFWVRTRDGKHSKLEWTGRLVEVSR